MIRLHTAFLTLFVILLLSVHVSAEEFFLKQTLFEGESRNYDVGGYVYEIKLIAVFDSQQKAQFEVNGEDTGILGEDDSEKLSDGAVIFVRSVMPQEAGDGKDLVQFNFFPAAHEEVSQTVVTSQETTFPAEQDAEPVLAQQAETEPSVHAAPEVQESKVDITRSKPTTSWWDSLVEWLKGLFS